MHGYDLFDAFFILAPIAALLIAGVWITLGSLQMNLATRAGRRTALGNLSMLLLRLAGVGAGLIALARFLGLPLSLSW